MSATNAYVLKESIVKSALILLLLGSSLYAMDEGEMIRRGVVPHVTVGDKPLVAPYLENETGFIIKLDDIEVFRVRYSVSGHIGVQGAFFEIMDGTELYVYKNNGHSAEQRAELQRFESHDLGSNAHEKEN